MVVDGLDWDKAHVKFQQVVNTNREGLFLATLPYKFGIGIALGMGFGSVPMIFQLDTALWFNEVSVSVCLCLCLCAPTSHSD